MRNLRDLSGPRSIQIRVDSQMASREPTLMVRSSVS